MDATVSSTQFPTEPFPSFISQAWHTTFTDSSMGYYWGPCSCPWSVDRHPFTAGINEPVANSTLITGQATPVKWDTSSTSANFTLYLSTSTCKCYITDTSIQFNGVIDDVRTIGTFPNTGEYEWTPSKDLESRADYVLVGTWQDGDSLHSYYMGYYTILKNKGDQPLVLEDPKDIQSNLSAHVSTSSVQGTTSSTAPASLTSFTGALSTAKTTGGAPKSRASWKMLASLSMLTWLCR